MRASASRLTLPGIIAAIVAIDRLTKIWAIESLRPVHDLAVLPFFHLTYVENSGAAWGILQGRNVLLIAVSVILLVGLLFLRDKWLGKSLWSYYGVALVAGGAVGNLYDRIVYGYVVDFFDFLIWPVFNVADSCITVGACALAWGMHLADVAERRHAGK